MSLPYTAVMMESIKKVEAGRAARIGFEPRRMTADEKTALLEAFHPDYNLDSFDEIKVGPNAGQKAPKELVEILQGESRIKGMDLDLTKPDYDVDVLVIGGGGAGSSAAIWMTETGSSAASSDCKGFFRGRPLFFFSGATVSTETAAPDSSSEEDPARASRSSAFFIFS